MIEELHLFDYALQAFLMYWSAMLEYDIYSTKKALTCLIATEEA